MIRLRVFSDLHLHPFKAGATLDPETGRNSRLQAGKGVLQQILDVDRNRPWQPDLTLFGGDWFHQRGLIPTTALLASVEALQGAPSIYGIAGNHDRTETGESALHGIARNRFFTFDQPAIDRYSISDSTVSTVTLILLPHTDDLDAAAAILAHAVDVQVRSAAKDGPVVLLAHNAIDLPGNAIPPGEPAWTLGMLKPVFAAAPDVLLLFGHLHSPRAWRGDVPVPIWAANSREGRLAIQIGSPQQLDWGDAGEERGYWEIEWNPKMHGSPWEARFCPIVAPHFVDLRETPDAQVWPQDFVRAAAPPAGDVPSSTWEVIPAVEQEQKKDRADLSAALPDAEILSRYLDFKAPDLDRDAVLRLGQELLSGGGAP
jgi:DNA repair exonuclease SbcCD nuclease subunit